MQCEAGTLDEQTERKWLIFRRRLRWYETEPIRCPREATRTVQVILPQGDEPSQTMHVCDRHAQPYMMIERVA